MSKNTLYLIAAILALIIIATIWAPKTQLIARTASPVNGLVDSGHPSASMEKPASESVPAPAAAPATPAAPATFATPTAADATIPTSPAAAVEPPKDKAMDADDVPAGVEVAPAPTPSMTKPAEDKGIVIPPSEGQ